MYTCSLFHSVVQSPLVDNISKIMLTYFLVTHLSETVDNISKIMLTYFLVTHLSETMANSVDPGSEVIKKYMLSSAEHEILNAHKYKNIKKFGFLGSYISLELYFPAH